MINKSKLWPENLGVGKPYNPDERIQDYLIFYCKEKLNDLSSKKHLQDIIDYSEDNINEMSINHVLGFQAIKIIRSKEESESFINKLNSKHKSDSNEMNFINNFKRNGLSNSYKKFDLLRKILLLK